MIKKKLEILRELLKILFELLDCLALVFEHPDIDKNVVRDICGNFHELIRIKEKLQKFQSSLPPPTNTTDTTPDVSSTDAKLVLNNTFVGLPSFIKLVEDALKSETKNLIELSDEIQRVHSLLNYYMNSLNQANEIIKSQ